MNSDRPEPNFAASTLAATAWLIAFHPDRLAQWLGRHPDGAALERRTRELMVRKAERKAREKEGTE